MVSPEAQDERTASVLCLVHGVLAFVWGRTVNPSEHWGLPSLCQLCEQWEMGFLGRVYWLWSQCGQFGAPFSRGWCKLPGFSSLDGGPSTQSIGSGGAVPASHPHAASPRLLDGLQWRCFFTGKKSIAGKSFFCNLSIQSLSWTAHHPWHPERQESHHHEFHLRKSVWYLIFKETNH